MTASSITPVITHSALDLSGSAFSTHVYNAIAGLDHHTELVYTDVPPAWGVKIVDYLNEVAEHLSVRQHYNPKTQVFWVRIMPTEMHDCHQIWWREEEDDLVASGLLTALEKKHLKPQVGTTMKILQPPYAGARKEPDLLIRPDNRSLPSVVIESGWSESYSRLLDDVNLWLLGGNGAVNAVLLLKWERIGNSNEVSGIVEMFSLDNNGMPVLRQREAIFPRPSNQAQQRIHLTRRLFFGSTMFPGRSNDTISLKLDTLRVAATDALTLLGLVPA